MKQHLNNHRITKALKSLGFSKVNSLQAMYKDDMKYFITRNIMNDGGWVLHFRFRDTTYKFRESTNQILYANPRTQAWIEVDDCFDPTDVSTLMVLYT